MFEVKIKSDFSAAHRLKDYNGECENFHGHNWKVQLTIAREKLDVDGMVIDFKILIDHLENFLKNLDHKCLNDLEYFEKLNPTSEHVAFVIYNNLSPIIDTPKIKLSKVEVWESDNSSACFIP